MSDARRGDGQGLAGCGPPPLPLQGPLDRLTQFIGRYAMLAVLVLAVGVVVVKLVTRGFPDAAAAFDGRDILTDHDRPNYLRNFLELMSFLAPVGLLAAALWAFVFTKAQIEYTRTQVKEARDTRLATLYATLEQRWSSPEMIRSKTLFAQMTFDYGDYRRAEEARGLPAMALDQFAHRALLTLQKTSIGDYFALMSLPEYLEYIGMLHRQRYVTLDDISYILGLVCIEVTTTMAAHIKYLRARAQGNNAYPQAPEEFVCLIKLAEAFESRFKDEAQGLQDFDGLPSSFRGMTAFQSSGMGREIS